MTRIRRHRWVLAAALAVSTHLLLASAGIAEQDHLKGYGIRDLNHVAAPSGYTMTTRFGGETCTLSKPLYFLVQAEKNGGDDPRGGAAGDFVCYRARCSGVKPPVTDTDTQFGVHKLYVRSARVVCLPTDEYVCGDNELDPGEACDGTAGTCPGSQICSPICTCVAPCASGGGDPQACQAAMTNNSCAVCCVLRPDFACRDACSNAVTLSCADSAANDQCGAEINAAGCALACCN